MLLQINILKQRSPNMRTQPRNFYCGDIFLHFFNFFLIFFVKTPPQKADFSVYSEVSKKNFENFSKKLKKHPDKTPVFLSIMRGKNFFEKFLNIFPKRLFYPQ